MRKKILCPYPGVWLSVAFSALVVLPAVAQEPQPGNGPSAQSQARDQEQQDQSSNQGDKQKEKDKDKKDNKTGKSKLEKETGTVNDRIFEVMPNYGTVENVRVLPPMTVGQKFRLATAGAFDYFVFPFNGALAAIDQANNSPKSWGQGWAAYGKRYGSSFGDNSIGTYMTTAVFPSMFREDPRYYTMSKGPFSRRVYHAINRLFVTRTDSGRSECNYSELIGNATATAFSNVYHAPEDRTFSRNIGTFGLLLLWDGLGNQLKEFWPDIRRKVFHKRLS